MFNTTKMHHIGTRDGLAGYRTGKPYSVHSEYYSWGSIIKVEFGMMATVTLHDNGQAAMIEAINNPGKIVRFTDETNENWMIEVVGQKVIFRAYASRFEVTDVADLITELQVCAPDLVARKV